MLTTGMLSVLSYGPSNPTPCRLIVAKLVERDVTGQLAADFRHLGSILHDSLAKTIRKLGKATVPDLPPKSRSLAGETELDPQEQRLLSLLQLVLSISRTIGAVARFLPRDLASNTLGSTSDLLEEFSQSYDILSALLEQASAISLRYRNGHGAAVGNDIPGDEASSLPSFDMSEIPPPLEESLDDRQLAVHVTGPNDSAERIYSAISSTKAALLAGIHVVLYEFYYEAAVAASESDSELAASIASELVSVIWTLVSNTPPKDVALYAVNAPLVLDLEIRFNLSDVIRAAVIQAGASSDADAASSEYVIKWLNDAVTTSGNAAEKWRYGTSRSHMLGDDQFDRLSVSGGPPTPDPRGGRDDGGRGRSPEGRLDQYAGDVAVHFSEDYIKRTSLIAQIKDLFPELGEGFIEACLIVFEDDAERVIMSVLEDSLPSSLQKLDRLMPRAPQASPGLRQVSPPEQPPAYDDLPPPSVLQERRNVFDGDEFDILSARGNVDVGDSIRLGKKR